MIQLATDSGVLILVSDSKILASDPENLVTDSEILVSDSKSSIRLSWAPILVSDRPNAKKMALERYHGQ